jgi:mRNA interferase MazF
MPVVSAAPPASGEPDPRRGEVWRMDMEPTRGAEMRKIRPVVVIGSDAARRLPVRLVVPFTDWKQHYAPAIWMVRVEPTPANGLSKTSAADTLQMRGADTGRFMNRIGVLADDDLARLAETIAAVVEYAPPVPTVAPEPQQS